MIVIGLCLSLLFSILSYAADTFTLDPAHTYVLWGIKHFAFSTQTGKWYANGTLLLDKNNPKNSTVHATIKMDDIITGIPELDKHLKSKLFFDTAHFKTATFISNKVEVVDQNTAKVYGMLTLHGISKPITLDVKLNKIGMNPITNKMTAGFSATTILKRSDFGITTLLPGLSDEVTLDIAAEAYKTGSV
jgi:polyisoprenoid-binding protein YceI